MAIFFLLDYTSTTVWRERSKERRGMEVQISGSKERRGNEVKRGGDKEVKRGEGSKERRG